MLPSNKHGKHKKTLYMGISYSKGMEENYFYMARGFKKNIFFNSINKKEKIIVDGFDIVFVDHKI